jgi:DNA-directed RNA polymerase subunit RPC12/RpoP
LFFVIIEAIYPYKCSNCNVRMVLNIKSYPNVKRCPHCGRDINDL